ncbi:hypothetical protein EZS27_023915 [termite gut metagenome]|uniref:Uncharacterized protein n=1 Tax=termite gut metagenome TaxID=433724 RepID=A0A5J4R030_9ZZZZ
MENLKELEVKCLENMPMMLDVISLTVNKLKNILTQNYAELEQYITGLLGDKYCLTDEWERGVIYALGGEHDYKEKYLTELIPYMELCYTIPFAQNVKKNQILFDVQLGYILDEKQNVIYFQLRDYSSILFVKEIIDLINRDAISNNWKYGHDENSVWVEFTPNETLSIEKINNCSEAFKKHILEPFFFKINQ